MSLSDITFVLQWWLMFFVIGLIFLPLTTRIFSSFFDKGYIFAKAIGMALISYVVFVLGILKIIPFTELTIFLTIAGFLIINVILIRRLFPMFTFEESLRNTSKVAERTPSRWTSRIPWKIFLLEEIVFLTTLFFWSFIRAHQPDIHGLEKYMDFGFINSILRSEYFPPRDMWFTPLPINYYYFGHLVTAVLTKISTIPSSITYNLMLSTIFALTFTGAFSIGANLIYLISNTKIRKSKQRDSGVLWTSQSPQNAFRILLAGLLTAFIVSFAGNLHTIYLFFKPYQNENPVPFWQLAFSPNSFPNAYWYPNATRFIDNTIHEFPIYSSVVSDLHGHFLSVPFVLLTIALLFSIISKSKTLNPKQYQNSNIQNSKYFGFGNWNLFGAWNFEFRILLLVFLLAIMYMTNAWDGLIYLLLSILIIGYVKLRSMTYASQHQSIKYYVSSLMSRAYFIPTTLYLILIFIGFFVFSLPFNLSFKPFASGIGILCAPEFLTNIGKLGPFLFEKDHCQRSPLWQLLILYGFFYFWVISFIFFLLKKYNSVISSRFSVFGFRFIGQSVLQSDKLKTDNRMLSSDVFVLILIFISTLLIVLPEFIYIKDIYPAHYRANTMFKLVYQSFVMLSIASAYIIIRLILSINKKIFAICYMLFAILFFILVMIYPYFAINSYYNGLKDYQGLDGVKYLKTLYPTDYSAILWINKNIKGQPVILEAQGDSYTDYGRVSTNTGLSTVLGWPVHEWLWRGSYDIPSPRIEELQKMYESEDLEDTKNLLKKYKVELVFFGDLERQKYPNLNEEKFKNLGKVVYQNRDTKIYEIFF